MPKQDVSHQPQRSPSLPEPLKYAISLILLVFAIAIVAGMSTLRESNRKVETDALIPLVETADVSSFQGNLDLVLSGTVVPFREIQVGAQVSGRLFNAIVSGEGDALRASYGKFWLIPCIAAGVIMILFFLLFKDKVQNQQPSEETQT